LSSITYKDKSLKFILEFCDIISQLKPDTLFIYLLIVIRFPQFVIIQKGAKTSTINNCVNNYLTNKKRRWHWQKGPRIDTKN